MAQIPILLKATTSLGTQVLGNPQPKAAPRDESSWCSIAKESSPPAHNPKGSKNHCSTCSYLVDIRAPKVYTIPLLGLLGNRKNHRDNAALRL